MKLFSYKSRRLGRFFYAQVLTTIPNNVSSNHQGVVNNSIGYNLWSTKVVAAMLNSNLLTALQDRLITPKKVLIRRLTNRQSEHVV